MASSPISIDTEYATSFIDHSAITAAREDVVAAMQTLHGRTGPGSDFLGWTDISLRQPDDLYERIIAAAERIKQQSEVAVVIGIGGSYLGARAAISALQHSFHNELPSEARQAPVIYHAGINIAAVYLQHMIEAIGERDFSVIVISKSGTTTEPAIAFRRFRRLLESRYGKAEAASRIYAITDKSRGALRTLADREGYMSFVVPDDVGGRFSVLTPVGLLPLAAAGIDISEMIRGARTAVDDLDNPDPEKNIALRYAAVRNALYRSGKHIEILVNYDPRLSVLAEWWKQLYGESEGKDGKGIFPASVDFTTDLHSLGQLIQDGRRNLFETVLLIQNDATNLSIQEDPDNLDGLNYLAGKTMAEVNSKAALGTLQAHVAGGVPNIIMHVNKLDAFHLGYLFFLFEKACAISGYALGVNPFDQPGVEAYKKSMFALLGKPS